MSYEDSINKNPYHSNVVIDPLAESHPFIDKMGGFKLIQLLENLRRKNVKDLMYWQKDINKKE